MAGSVRAQYDTAESPKVIKVPAAVFEDKEIYDYFVEALKLALAKTAQNKTSTVIKADPNNANQDRLLRQVKEGSTDVTWAVASAEREQENLAVYFPLMRGLLGYRVFIIHPDSTQQFADIELDALKQLVAVQGIGWPDTDALRNSQLTVEEVPFSMTFKLIDTGMADYYPRSVVEVRNEITNRPDLQLELEKSVDLYYPSPVYFFVSKENQALANRIKRGLELAFADGSLEALFNTRAFAIEAKAILENRRVIHLENPTLTEESKRILDTYNSYFIHK
ncbi:transporter substrate-binding domain-containing protein [Alteromonas gilva]|uniref:Transporter substrate-binding domain-containing protein n=1 Tax=Alteromonas gilva TaxID=2987522 RepID=A0ABT5L1Z3_9ALTE|nr:transporter substrate-binding domain-containing protein [Alteromonas gilva]MDC8831065.1 transporter substrate-binding domain-containing protein [Alteromonas gilva]